MESSRKLPALRPLDVAPFRNERNEPYFALHDLTQIAPHPIAVSLPGYFVLSHLDGRHTCEEIQAAFLKQFGQVLSADQIEGIVAKLDQALLLDSPGFEAAYARQRDAYLAGETRDNRQRSPVGPELRREIERMLDGGAPASVSDMRGIVAPHLDYQRGSPCYALAYATLRQQPAAERYVILGTNHFGRSAGPVATTLDFLTPLGRVTTDRKFIGRLNEQLGGSLCEHEFDHNFEHSVELQVQVLQVCYPQRPLLIVPVLCPDPCGRRAATASGDAGPSVSELADALAGLLAEDERRTVLIAGADLSHMGQRFGDDHAATPATLRQVEREDRELLNLLERREEEAFVEHLRTTGNPTRICSAGCIYALFRALPGRRCRILHYHQATDMAADVHVTCAAAVLGG